MSASASVYAIVGPDGSRCYVGSTLNTIQSRLVRHQSRARTNERPNSRLHNFMKEKGPEKFKVELISIVPIEDRLRTEAHHIRADGRLNHAIPGRTRAEWRRDRRTLRAEVD